MAVSDETTASTVAAASITTALATAAASSSAARVMTTVTAMASAVATAAIAAPQTAIAVSEPQGECRLLGSFALIIQVVLGGLALLSLVFKRWRERPQRPVKIWFFDVSKQVFGSVLVHVANIFMSMLTSGRFSIKLDPAVTQRLPMARDSDSDYTPNPCSFYLLNLAIDTTLGIPILIILLRILTGLAALTPFGDPPDSIRSGNYGSPPNAGWWLKQSILYFCGLFAMKLCILLIFILMPWISQVGDWALGWTASNERLQIAFVMMIFPLVMNALQYYIIDSFIKQSEPSHERLPSRDPDETRLRYDAATRLAGRPRHATAHGVDLNDDDDDDDDSIGPLVNTTPSARLPVRSRLALGGEYDPEVDGNAPTVIGSTSSRHLERNSKLPPPEFFPKE